MAARINIAGGTLKVSYDDGTEDDDVPYPSADVRLSTGPSRNRPAPRNSGVKEDLEVPGTHSDVCHYPSFVGAVSLLPLAITPSLLPSFAPSLLRSFPPSRLFILTRTHPCHEGEGEERRRQEGSKADGSGGQCRG